MPYWAQTSQIFSNVKQQSTFSEKKTSKKKKLSFLWLLMATLWTWNCPKRSPMNLLEKLFAKLEDFGTKISKYGKFQLKIMFPFELSSPLLYLMLKSKIYLNFSILLSRPSPKNHTLKVWTEPYFMIHLIVINKFRRIEILPNQTISSKIRSWLEY